MGRTALISFDRGRIVEQYFKATEEIVAYRGDGCIDPRGH